MNDELSRAYAYDELKFRHSSARELDAVKTYEQLTARLIYSTHAVEKGLSNSNFELGRGQDNIRLLVHLIEVYKRRNYDESSIAYVAAISSLREFYSMHENTSHSSDLKLIYADFLDEILTCESKAGGVDVVKFSGKKDTRSINFRELVQERSSIRSYSDRPVDLVDIEDALSIAMKTPTVCNRQSIKVRVVRKPEIISQILEVQGGAIGYDTPPALLLITANDAAYLGANERNQGFIDGGLFAMSVLYALEYKSLAACALNAALTEEAEKRIRGMMNIPSGEKLITFISVGHFQELSRVCKSFRYDAASIMEEVEVVHDYTVEDERTPDDSVAVSVVEGRPIVSRLKDVVVDLKQKTRVRTRYRDFLDKRVVGARVRRFDQLDGAIVTLIDYNNYGNIMQRYALQEFLLQNGYAFTSLEHELPVSSTLSDDRVRLIASFVDRNIFISPAVDSQILPCYIAGSDQIWRDFNYAKPKEMLGFFFLNFTSGQDVRRVAYAASFGRNSLADANITEDLSAYLKPLVLDFDAISVRETTASGVINDAWGVSSDQVIDPTMLLAAGWYSNLVDRSRETTVAVNGVFSYLIGVSDENEKILKAATESLGVDLYRIDLADYSGPLPPVEQWLRGLRDARLAIVDSFHGAVFSILNNTDFIVLENRGSGLERMTNLLELFGIEGRIIMHSDVGQFSLDDLPPIDWNSVDKRLSDLRTRSAQWLLDAVRPTKDV